MKEEAACAALGEVTREVLPCFGRCRSGRGPVSRSGFSAEAGRTGYFHRVRHQPRRAMSDDDHSPISAPHAKVLFAHSRAAPALVLAVSGGPDFLALMWLAARWRRTLLRGPRLIAVTIDHDLRPEAAREARFVKRLARTLDIPHRTLRWTGAKPNTGLPAAARAARYLLLAKAARASGATRILTAHPVTTRPRRC